MSAVDFIKENITKEKIINMIGSHGAKNITVTDNEIRSTCPLHGGNNPSAFVWNLENGLWFCFTGCQCGGDIFEYIAHKYDLSVTNEFKDIVKQSAEDLDIDISNMSLGERATRNRRELREWFNYCESRTRKTNKAFDIKVLGNNYLLKEYRGFNSDMLKQNNVYYNQAYNRIICELKDEYGLTVGATLRRINESEDKKWLNRPKGLDTGLILYNLNNIVISVTEVTVVEGITDVLRLKQLGLESVVASLGSHLTDEQADILLSRFLTVNIMRDNDKAGREGTIKDIKLLKNKCNIFVYDLSELMINDPYEIESEEKLKLLTKLRWFDFMQRYAT